LRSFPGTTRPRKAVCIPSQCKGICNLSICSLLLSSAYLNRTLCFLSLPLTAWEIDAHIKTDQSCLTPIKLHMLVQKKGTGISGLTSKRYKRYFRKCRHRQNSKLVRHIDFYPTRDSVKETDIDTNLTTTNLEKSVSSVNSLNSLYRYRTKRLVQCYISRYFLKLAITVR